MNGQIIRRIILFTIVSCLLLVQFTGSVRSTEQFDLKMNNPFLNFYFDEQSFLLYLENIGDETAYNITISIHIDGFIVFGDEKDFSYKEQPLEPGQKRAIIAMPLVFGFGPIEILYTASALNAEPTSFSLKAFLIGSWPFLWGY
jgi:hypothetical protein